MTSTTVAFGKSTLAVFSRATVASTTVAAAVTSASMVDALAAGVDI